MNVVKNPDRGEFHDRDKSSGGAVRGGTPSNVDMLYTKFSYFFHHFVLKFQNFYSNLGPFPFSNLRPCHSPLGHPRRLKRRREARDGVNLDGDVNGDFIINPTALHMFVMSRPANRLEQD